MSSESSNITAFKKKLFRKLPEQKLELDTQRTRDDKRVEICDSRDIQRQVRQLLADKVNGNLVGTWFLAAEHLELGTWDLIRGWCGPHAHDTHARIAMQLVNEAALCATNVRQTRSLSQRGFEVANGLPFLASDKQVHLLLDAHTIQDSLNMQIALGKIRMSRNEFCGRRLAIDPHRMTSYSKRQMRRRPTENGGRSKKASQVFFCLDPDTQQPVAFTIASCATTAADAARKLLPMVREILGPISKPLVLADCEHVSASLFESVLRDQNFDLLMPQHKTKAIMQRITTMPENQFMRRWAGYVTASLPYQFHDTDTQIYQLIQRCGERPDQYEFKPFLSTRGTDEVTQLTQDFPKRWNLEEYYKSHQALGWEKAGTMNLNIRYGRMSMALVAQAALSNMRKKIGEPYSSWDAQHFAECLLAATEGDIRVRNDTIVITLYNTPNVATLKNHYEHLPQKLQARGINPAIPWLYGFKLDFRFK